MEKLLANHLMVSKKKKTGDAVIIDRKVFHQTINNSKKDAIIMEIETPNDKGDLIRLTDKYGRADKGYEKADKFDVNLTNYNYMTLKSQNVFYNFTKKYGNSSIIFKKVDCNKGFNKLIDDHKNSLVTILDGSIEIDKKEYNLSDTFFLKKYKKFKLKSKYCLLILTNQNTKKNRVSDIVLDTLRNNDVTNLFFIPSDSNLHLLDAVGRDENINYFILENDSAAAIASSAIAKYLNKPAGLILSSGVSSARAIEAIGSAYVDSEPLVIISGSSNRTYDSSKLRQNGSKSLMTSYLVKNITKYSIVIKNENAVAYEIQKAVYLSKVGRPGPVWIEIPLRIL